MKNFAKLRFLITICVLPVCGCTSLGVIAPDPPAVRIVMGSETGNCRPLGPVAVSTTFTPGVNLERAAMQGALDSAAAMGANALSLRSQSVTSQAAASVSLTYAVQGQAYSCP